MRSLCRIQNNRGLFACFLILQSTSIFAYSGVPFGIRLPTDFHITTIAERGVNHSTLHEEGDAPEIDDRSARLELSRTLKAEKKEEEALEQYQILLKDSPKDPTLLLEAAQILAELKRNNEALEYIDPIRYDQLNEKQKLTLANIYTSLKQFDKAQGILEELLAKHPDSSKIRLFYADVLSWEKHYDESITHYEKLVEKHPDDIQLRRKYAMVLIWSGNRSKGAEELKKTLSTPTEH